MKNILFIPFLLILLLNIIGCGNNPVYTNISIAPPSSETSEIESFSPDNYGYVIYDPETKATVKAHNIYGPFIPASVSKIFTAVFALEILKPEYTFKTELLYTGKCRHGIIEGDIILRGGGDPELSFYDLVEMITELKQNGIKKVNGNFYYDIDYFDSKEVLDKDMPLNARYNTGSGPLNLNKNIVYALKRKDEKGKIISCDLLPSTPANRIFLYEEKPVLLYAKYSNNNGTETWGMPSGANWENRFKLPVKNSGLYTSYVFRTLSMINGINLPEPVKGKNISGEKILVVHKSRNLSHIIKDMFSTSDNLVAEIIGTTAMTEMIKSCAQKDLTVEHFFRNTFPSVKWEGLKLINYSGLTDINRATPEQTVAMLMHLNRMNTPIYKMLPLSGINGTMKNRLNFPETAFRVYAKTGTIYYASSLAGEFTACSGKKYYFSVYLNDQTKRKNYTSSKNENINKAVEADKWSASAVKAIDNFITEQIAEL